MWLTELSSPFFGRWNILGRSPLELHPKISPWCSTQAPPTSGCPLCTVSAKPAVSGDPSTPERPQGHQPQGLGDPPNRGDRNPGGSAGDKRGFLGLLVISQPQRAQAAAVGPEQPEGDLGNGSGSCSAREAAAGCDHGQQCSCQDSLNAADPAPSTSPCTLHHTETGEVFSPSKLQHVPQQSPHNQECW